MFCILFFQMKLKVPGKHSKAKSTKEFTALLQKGNVCLLPLEVVQ